MVVSWPRDTSRWDVVHVVPSVASLPLNHLTTCSSHPQDHRSPVKDVRRQGTTRDNWTRKATRSCRFRTATDYPKVCGSANPSQRKEANPHHCEKCGATGLHDDVRSFGAETMQIDGGRPLKVPTRLGHSHPPVCQEKESCLEASCWAGTGSSPRGESKRTRFGLEC